MWNAEACFAYRSGVHALTGLTTCMYIAARGAENTGKQDGTKRCLNLDTFPWARPREMRTRLPKQTPGPPRCLGGGLGLTQARHKCPQTAAPDTNNHKHEDFTSRVYRNPPLWPPSTQLEACISVCCCGCRCGVVVVVVVVVVVGLTRKIRECFRRPQRDL